MPPPVVSFPCLCYMEMGNVTIARFTRADISSVVMALTLAPQLDLRSTYFL